jgi:acetyl-CoA/propionyl-CoA carboxylase biotin carboxyl carrier protein
MSERTLLLRDAFGGEHRVTATAEGALVEGSLVRVELQPDGAVRLDSGPGHLAWTAISGDTRWVYIDGEVFVFEAGRPSARRRRASAAQGSLTAPMPATVRQVVVSPGARVQQGDVLLVLEAMKMELPVRAPADGTVVAVKCRQGELVQAGQELIELEP